LRQSRRNLAATEQGKAELVLGYLRNLSTPRFILWCYLIWWICVAATYFDPSPRLWLNSLGISGIIGTALYLSTAYSGPVKQQMGKWALARLFMMPFCVSSFAALIKGQGFFLVFPPSLRENLVALSACLLLGIIWQIARRTSPQEARRFIPPFHAVGLWVRRRIGRRGGAQSIP
jgi:hypothetical protein